MIGKGIGEIFEVGFYVFFWLIFVFVILERIDKEKDLYLLIISLKKWILDDLKNVLYILKKKVILKFEIFGGLMWIVIWVIFYFYVNYFVGVYYGIENGLKFVVLMFN